MVSERESLLVCPLCDVVVDSFSCPECGRTLDELSKEQKKLTAESRKKFLAALKAQRRLLIEPCSRMSIALRRSVIDCFEEFHRKEPKSFFKGQRVETALIEYMAKRGVENLPSLPEERQLPRR